MRSSSLSEPKEVFLGAACGGQEASGLQPREAGPGATDLQGLASAPEHGQGPPTHPGGALPGCGDGEPHFPPGRGSRSRRARLLAAPSQAGPHRIAAESHRTPRGECPAEQPPSHQHRGGQHGHQPLSPSQHRGRGRRAETASRAPPPGAAPAPPLRGSVKDRTSRVWRCGFWEL